MSPPLRLAVVQSAMPAYRQAFVEAVFDELGDSARFLTGDEHYGTGVVTELKADPRILRADNVYLFHRRALWQRGVLRDAVRAEVCVIEINPRTLSSWVILTLRGLRRRPTVMWGHAWSRKGINSRTNRLRMFMCRRAAGIIVYTESDRQLLTDRLHVDDIWTAPNAITPDAEMRPVAISQGADNFVVSGRLVEEKKPGLAIAAFAHAIDRLPADSRLVFVGKGPMLDELRAAAAASRAAGRVDFLGTVFDTDRLREIYTSALASLSPGYVGLSMTQSHAFGLPMIYARNEPHAPEIEAAEEGFNAIGVENDDKAALADAMVAVFEDRESWSARREAISKRCREHYSVEAMAAGFLAAIKEAR